MANETQDSKQTGVPALPVGEILLNVAESLVKAQQILDQSSLATEIRIREQELDKFGLKASWYTIPELDFDLRLAFELDQRGELKTQMVDAEYQSRYGFNVKASSLLQTKIKAVPPLEAQGLSLLDEKTVLKRVGQIKKVVEAYDRADTPYFLVRYRAFVPQGYAGGLWYVFIMDTLQTGQRLVHALAVVNDEDGKIIRLWSSENAAIQ
jgi:hypothetical protein